MNKKRSDKASLFRVLASTVMIAMALLLSACATDDDREIDPNSNSTQRNTSAIPWNRPQSWEGSTGYGGMMNQPR